MAQLTMKVQIDSRQTDGNVKDWSWLVDSAAADINPPPRMKINDTFNLVVSDDGNAPKLDATLTVSSKIENPLKGKTGKGSPFKQGNANGGPTVCGATFSGIAANGGVYTFTPPDNVFLEPGAWEATVVLSASTGTQFELDPEFDVGT
jgi:hypothetical protein